MSDSLAPKLAGRGRVVVCILRRHAEISLVWHTTSVARCASSHARAQPF